MSHNQMASLKITPYAAFLSKRSITCRESILSHLQYNICTPDVLHKKFRARIRLLKLVGTLQLWFFRHDIISDADLQSQ